MEVEKKDENRIEVKESPARPAKTAKENEDDKMETEKAKKSCSKRRGRRKRKSKRSELPDAAPRNTTQFIMDDHSDTIQYLDKKLGVSKDHPSNERPLKEKIIRRARDSSFSVDSGDEADFGIDEDVEEAFIKKEFLKDYNSARTDKLGSLSKGDLVKRYIRMENRVDMLEKRLIKLKKRNFHVVNANVNPDVSEKIRMCREHIRSLELENRRLNDENRKLRARKMRRPSTQADENEEDQGSSSSSSSYCTTCSSASESSSSGSEDEDNVEDANDEQPMQEAEPTATDDNAQDTGYDSSNNGATAAKANSSESVTSTTK